ncbi:hypothetical protein GPA10_26810 [Streptomyces sp. p1417]|uniref:Uncharacterized protein n=1 Tax=Streptomyces typhae TaxID=2681492 RepID=A0A6L6X372_9ACTN|nr:hypothetical protein [Streptomyces typhae]MVO88274.1 hypothetical protein [Streptomyces typhae]
MILETDDAVTADVVGCAQRAVRAVTALGRPRWVVATDEVGECLRAATARGLDVTPGTSFLTLTGPVLSGEHHVLRCGRKVRSGDTEPAGSVAGRALDRAEDRGADGTEDRVADRAATRQETASR